MLAWDGFKARRKGRTPPTFGRRIIGVMEKNIIPKKGFRRLPQLSVGMHKIDLFLFPDVSKYQKVIEIKGQVPYVRYTIFYIWDGTLFVPFIYFIDKTSSSCDKSHSILHG
jgi:hypothetical protein